LIFIDGDHSYENALIDLKHTLTFIEAGDVLVVHDVFKAPEVKYAIADFLKNNPRKYKEIPSSAGIGVIEW
jgi:cephalosporin hydroxylase